MLDRREYTGIFWIALLVVFLFQVACTIFLIGTVGAIQDSSESPQPGWVMHVANLAADTTQVVTTYSYDSYEQCFRAAAAARDSFDNFVAADCVPREIIIWDDENQKMDFNEEDYGHPK